MWIFLTILFNFLLNNIYVHDNKKNDYCFVNVLKFIIFTVVYIKVLKVPLSVRNFLIMSKVCIERLTLTVACNSSYLDTYNSKRYKL